MNTDTGKVGSWFKTHWYWLLAIAAGIIIGVLYIWPMISGFLGNLFSGLGASSPSSATIPTATTGSGTASSGSGTVQTGTGTSTNAQRPNRCLKDVVSFEKKVILPILIPAFEFR